MRSRLSALLVVIVLSATQGLVAGSSFFWRTPENADPPFVPGQTLSLVINAYWNWVAMPLFAGWLMRGRIWGLVGGMLSCVVSNILLFVGDWYFGNFGQGLRASDTPHWWMYSLVMGSFLGWIGTYIRGSKLLLALGVLATAMLALLEISTWHGPPVGASPESVYWSNLVFLAGAVLALVVLYARLRTGGSRTSRVTAPEKSIVTQVEIMN